NLERLLDVVLSWHGPSAVPAPSPNRASLPCCFLACEKALVLRREFLISATRLAIQVSARFASWTSADGRWEIYCGSGPSCARKASRSPDKAAPSPPLVADAAYAYA